MCVCMECSPLGPADVWSTCLAPVETSLGTDASIREKIKKPGQIWHLQNFNVLLMLSKSIFWFCLMASLSKMVKAKGENKKVLTFKIQRRGQKCE